MNREGSATVHAPRYRLFLWFTTHSATAKQFIHGERRAQVRTEREGRRQRAAECRHGNATVIRPPLPRRHGREGRAVPRAGGAPRGAPSSGCATACRRPGTERQQALWRESLPPPAAFKMRAKCARRCQARHCQCAAFMKRERSPRHVFVFY